MGIRHIVKNIIVAMSLTATAAMQAAVKDTCYLKVTHRVSAEVKPALNMPTHGFYRGYNDMGKAVPHAGSLHFKYGFTLGHDSEIGQRYPTVYQGIGLAVQSFFRHDLVGTPIMLYMFQGSHIADLGEKISLGYEWNLGASYGWKVNEVVGSKCNIYINVGLPFTWVISPNWELSAGPEYTHFSNGDTTFPNGGANTVGIRLGMTWKHKSEEEPVNQDSIHKTGKAPGKLLIQKEENLKSMKFAERLSYDMFMYGAWRADRYIHDGSLLIINKPHTVAGIVFNPLYSLNRYFSVGPGMDIMLDRSADRHSGTQKNPAIRQMVCGISAKAELTMPYLSINLGAGYSVLTAADDLKGFYTTYILKAFLSRKAFLTIGYRLGSVNYAHNLMFGVGARL